MTIHLDEDIFEIVKNGTKKIELRVNDEKRRKLKEGDTIVFLKRPEEKEKIEAYIEKLEYYNTFKEATDNYEIEDIYTKDYTKEGFLKLLSRFYTDEEIKKYGVVAIKFKITKK